MAGDLDLVGQLFDDLRDLFQQDAGGFRHCRAAKTKQRDLLLIKQLDPQAFGRGLDLEAIFEFFKLAAVLDLLADQPFGLRELGGLPVGEQLFQFFGADGGVGILAARGALGVLVAAEAGLDVLAVVRPGPVTRCSAWAARPAAC